ncbi:MAG: hypothetical protein K6356_06645 [Chloroflexus sp.]
MPRWYKGFHCSGLKPQRLINQLALLIQRYDLGDLVPVIRVEKQAGPGGYYFFLAIESPVVGQIPEKVQELLFQNALLRDAIEQPFTFNEIRSMVSAEHIVHDYVRLIPYVLPCLPPVSDPFDEPIEEMAVEEVARSNILLQTQQYDRLLSWLSATGQGSWQLFQQAWQTLGGKVRPQRVLRQLRLLGHLETSINRKRWAVAPSTIFPISSDERTGQWVLSGRRDTALLQHLQRHSDIEIEFAPQARGDGPATVYVYTRSAEHLAAALKTFNRPIYQVEPAGLYLARVLPSIAGWKQTLEPLQGVRPHAYTLKYFNGKTFVEIDFDRKSGLYELWPRERRSSSRGVIGPEYVLYYDAETDRWLRGDWYDLRFLVRYHAGQKCPVRWRSTTGQLAVPLHWRWPEIYERALVLASGCLPDFRQGWLIYYNIDSVLFEELRQKLSLDNEEAVDA